MLLRSSQIYILRYLAGMCTSDPRSDLDQSPTKAYTRGATIYAFSDIRHSFFLVATFYPHQPSNVKDLHFLYLSAGHGNTMIHYDPTLVQDQLYLLAEGTLLLEIGYTDLNYLQDHFHLGSGGAASFFG